MNQSLNSQIRSWFYGISAILGYTWKSVYRESIAREVINWGFVGQERVFLGKSLQEERNYFCVPMKVCIINYRRRYLEAKKKADNYQGFQFHVSIHLSIRYLLTRQRGLGNISEKKKR